MRGVYVLGALEMLKPYLPPDAVSPDAPLVQQARAWSAQGLRVLLFAYNPQAATLQDEHGQPYLPPLMPLAVVSLRDQLRPQSQETIAAFKQLGLELKIISGDDPETVAALANHGKWNNYDIGGGLAVSHTGDLAGSPVRALPGIGKHGRSREC